jgi:DDE superfamily endonuclease
VVVDRATGQIICVTVGNGRRHDFHLFKRSGVRFCPNILALGDSAYQGLQRLHANTALPTRRSKKHPLDPLDIALNRIISSERVLVENIIRRIKVFRIMSERYRNRRKRFGLRLMLIAGIVNAQLC